MLWAEIFSSKMAVQTQHSKTNHVRNTVGCSKVIIKTVSVAKELKADAELQMM